MTRKTATVARASKRPADPILAAIEKHIAAYRHLQKCGLVRGNTIDVKWSPQYNVAVFKAAKAADDKATKACDTAGRALIEIQPTTLAGIVALSRALS